MLEVLEVVRELMDDVVDALMVVVIEIVVVVTVDGVIVIEEVVVGSLLVACRFCLFAEVHETG